MSGTGLFGHAPYTAALDGRTTRLHARARRGVEHAAACRRTFTRVISAFVGDRPDDRREVHDASDAVRGTGAGRCSPMSTRWNFSLRARRAGSRTSSPTMRSIAGDASSNGNRRWPRKPGDAGDRATACPEPSSIDWRSERRSPNGTGLPVPGGFDFSQLMRMLQSQGPVNLEVARADRRRDRDHRPGDRTTGHRTAGRHATRSRRTRAWFAPRRSRSPTRPGIAGVLAVPARVRRPAQGWSATTIDGSGRCSKPLAGGAGGTPVTATDPDASTRRRQTGHGAGEDALFGFVMQNLMPMLLGVWSGSMIGQLSHHALGQYDLPLPLEDAPTLLFVTRNVDDFAEAWSLPVDELRYALVVARNRARRAAIGPVGSRASRAGSPRTYVGAYEMRPDALEGQLGGARLHEPGGDAVARRVRRCRRRCSARCAVERQGPLLEELQRFVRGARGLHRRGRRDDRRADGRPRTNASTRHCAAIASSGATRRRSSTGCSDSSSNASTTRPAWPSAVASSNAPASTASTACGKDRRWCPRRRELTAPGLWLARIELPAD